MKKRQYQIITMLLEAICCAVLATEIEYDGVRRLLTVCAFCLLGGSAFFLAIGYGCEKE